MVQIKFARASVLLKYNNGETFLSLAKSMGITKQAVQLKAEKELTELFIENPSLDDDIRSLALDSNSEKHWGLNLSGIYGSRVILMILRAKYEYYTAGSVYAFSSQRSTDSIRTHLLKIVGDSDIPLEVGSRKLILSSEDDLISLSLENEFSDFFHFSKRAEGDDSFFIIGFGHKGLLQNICRWISKEPSKNDDGFKRDIPSLYALFPTKAKEKEGFFSENDFYNYLIGKRNYIYGMSSPCKKPLLDFIKELLKAKKAEEKKSKLAVKKTKVKSKKTEAKTTNK